MLELYFVYSFNQLASQAPCRKILSLKR